MKVVAGIIIKFRKVVKRSKDQVLNGMDIGSISSETTVTDRFLGILENEINGHGQEIFQVKGVSIVATTLQDRGKDSQESEFGADFAVILDINLDGFVLKKGFLCQAKKEGRGIRIHNTRRPTTVRFSSNNKFKKLKIQTEKMLKKTPDSFVIVYGTSEFVVVPASSISSLKDTGILYGKSVEDFFVEFLLCFVGDIQISENPNQWNEVQTFANKIVKISIKQDNSRTSFKKNTSPPSLESVEQNLDKIITVNV